MTQILNILTIVIVFFWLILILKLTLTFVFVWYINEYRFDRLLIYLKTESGKRLYFLPLKIPIRSPKTVTLTILSLLSFGLVMYYYIANIWLGLGLTLIMSFPLISFWVLVLKIPTAIYHWLIIRSAYVKMKNYPQLKVVGVTGSFGKTTVKEIAAFLIAEKYKVIKTEKSQNSLIAAAELIVRKQTPETQVMVVEMGAYKKGEIKSICDLVKPQIGIVTAINAQHQDLFGSLENTVAAKYELIESLTGQKIAIFNADNKYTLAMADKTDGDFQDWLYTTKRVKHKENFNYLSAENIKTNLAGLTFDLIYTGKKYVVKSILVGEHQVHNILAGLAVGLSLDIKVETLIKRLTSFQPLPGTAFVEKGLNDSWFIDDTFNNNPDAAIAGLNILKMAKGKKYLVMQPMKELGKFAASAHAEVGEYAGKICDRVWLTNKDNYVDFKSGVGNADRVVEVAATDKIANWLRKNIGKEDAVLFKGKEAKPVLLKLTS